MNTTNHTIPINLILANQLGTDSTLVLQQIKYWTEKCGKVLKGEQGVWIYNSLNEWHKQFSHWSMSKLRRIIKSLEEQNLIVTKKVNAKKWNHTKWYSINFDKFNSLFDKAKNTAKKVLPKRTNRSVQNEQIINMQENSYTNKTPNPLTKGERNIEKSVVAEEQRLKPENKSEKLEYTKQSFSVNAFLNAWNNKINPTIPITLTLRRRRKLEKALSSHFQNDLAKWKEFLDHVLSSSFLSGKVTTFSATFDWVLRESNLLKILEGNYHASNAPKFKFSTPLNTQPLEDLKYNSKLDPRWKAILEDTIEMFGEGKYISWFSKLEFCSDRNGILTLEAPSKFIKEYMETYFARKILQIAEKYFEDAKKIRFVLRVPSFEAKPC